MSNEYKHQINGFVGFIYHSFSIYLNKLCKNNFMVKSRHTVIQEYLK